MSDYRPQQPFNVLLAILKPENVTVKGSLKKRYPKIEEVEEDDRIFASFKTFGGTETTKNDALVVEDTANIETWYRPDIKSDCRVAIVDTGATYEVLGEPENINMRNQYLKFKVRRIKGGA